jgi:ATP-binding cassette subfamily B protein
MGWWGDNVPEETLSRDEATRVVRRLLRMLRPWRSLIVVAVLVLMAQAATLLAGPLLVKHGIDAGLPSAHSPGDSGALDLAVLLYLVVAFAGFVLGRIAIVLVARVGEGFLRDLRNRLFGHMMSLSLDYFETEKTGKIVARMTSDIDAMEELVSQGLVLFVMNTFVFVGAITVVLIVSWQLAVGILVIVPPVYFGSRWFRRVSNKAYLEVRDSISTNLSTLQESLEGVRVVQAFGREDAFTRKFHRTNEDQYHANMTTVRISSKYFPIIEYAGVAGTAVIIGYGGWLTTRGVVTVGTVAAFVLWLNSLFEPINQLSQLYNTVQSSAAALAKIFGVLDTRPTVRQRQAAIDLPPSGMVEVDHVTFAYGQDRTRRPHRCGKVDAGQADRPFLRPGRRCGARRGRRPEGRRVHLAAEAHHRRAAGRLPLRGDPARQRARRPAGGIRRRRRRGAARPRAARPLRRLPRGSRDRGTRARIAALGR